MFSVVTWRPSGLAVANPSGMEQRGRIARPTRVPWPPSGFVDSFPLSPIIASAAVTFISVSVVANAMRLNL